MIWRSIWQADGDVVVEGGKEDPEKGSEWVCPAHVVRKRMGRREWDEWVKGRVTPWETWKFVGRNMSGSALGFESFRVRGMRIWVRDWVFRSQFRRVKQEVG